MELNSSPLVGIGSRSSYWNWTCNQQNRFRVEVEFGPFLYNSSSSGSNMISAQNWPVFISTILRLIALWKRFLGLTLSIFLIHLWIYFFLVWFLWKAKNLMWWIERILVLLRCTGRILVLVWLGARTLFIRKRKWLFEVWIIMFYLKFE